MFIFRLGARRQIGLLLRNGPATCNFKVLFDLDTCPHGDTLNDAFSKLIPEQMQEVVTKMTETLIRNKILYPYRLLDRFFVIAIDGTGTLSFNERHCSNCLTRTHNGKTTYYHNVLEAKLITANGFAFSIMTEFIENSGKNPTKHVLSVIECIETKPNKSGKIKSNKFKWVTDTVVSNNNVIELSNTGGRSRWKIESAPQAHRKEAHYGLRNCA